MLCYAQSRSSELHCSPPRSNSVVHDEAYGRGMSVSGRQRRQGWSWSAEAPPFCFVSRWLTSLDRKPRRTPENMTSSTKPKVHNILHCRQTWTEPLNKISLQLTCRPTKNREVWTYVIEIRKRTNRHTDNRNTSSHSSRDRNSIIASQI